MKCLKFEITYYINNKRSLVQTLPLQRNFYLVWEVYQTSHGPKAFHPWIPITFSHPYYAFIPRLDNVNLVHLLLKKIKWQPR